MLQLDNLSVDIAGIPVLRKLTTTLNSSAVYAVVGRNGAGKTTLLRTIMGFTSIKAGSISLAGEDLRKEVAYRRAAMGIAACPARPSA